MLFMVKVDGFIFWKAKPVVLGYIRSCCRMSALPSGIVDSGLYGLGEVGEHIISGYSGFIKFISEELLI